MVRRGILNTGRTGASVLVRWARCVGPAWASLLAFLAWVCGAQAQSKSVTEFQFHFGDGYKLGSNSSLASGFAETTKRLGVTVDHVTVGQVGDIYFFINAFHDMEPGSGKRNDYYGEFYANLSGRNFGLSFGENAAVRDLSFGLGLNRGSVTTAILAGPRLSFNAKGFRVLTLAAFAYDRVRDSLGRELDTTYQITLAWDAPFEIGGQRFSTKGFVDFIGPQGAGVIRQINFSPELRWDVGHAMGGPPDTHTLGLKYTFYKNKFGIDGVEENSLSLFYAIKF